MHSVWDRRNNMRFGSINTYIIVISKCIIYYIKYVIKNKNIKILIRPPNGQMLVIDPPSGDEAAVRLHQTSVRPRRSVWQWLAQRAKRARVAGQVQPRIWRRRRRGPRASAPRCCTLRTLEQTLKDLKNLKTHSTTSENLFQKIWKKLFKQKKNENET